MINLYHGNEFGTIVSEALSIPGKWIIVFKATVITGIALLAISKMGYLNDIIVDKCIQFATLYKNKYISNIF